MPQKKGAGGKPQEYDVEDGEYEETQKDTNESQTKGDIDFFDGEEKGDEREDYFAETQLETTFGKSIDDKVKQCIPLTDNEIEEVFVKMSDNYERPEKGKGDNNLKKILDMNGFSKTPRKVDKLQLANEIKNGEIMFRGLNGEESEKYGRQFYDGEMFVGVGIGGNGVYMSKEINEAENYTKGSNTVVVAIMPKDMKIAGKDVRNEYHAFYEKQKATDQHTKQEKERLFKIQKTMGFGSYCALKGYDAYLPAKSPEKNMVVLNRGKLVIGENNEQERIMESYRAVIE